MQTSTSKWNPLNYRLNRALLTAENPFVGVDPFGILEYSPTARVPRFASVASLEMNLPKGRIRASTFQEFQTKTAGWFTEETIFQRKYSAQQHMAEAWDWYKAAKYGTEELVLGEFMETRAFLRSHSEGYQRLYARPWNLQVNDAWVLGGVERGARFRVISDINVEKFRTTALTRTKTVESVFNRELRLLEQHGYAFMQDPTGPSGTGWMVPAKGRR